MVSEKCVYTNLRACIAKQTFGGRCWQDAYKIQKQLLRFTTRSAHNPFFDKGLYEYFVPYYNK